jgi:CRISPR-associated protein Csy1
MADPAIDAFLQERIKRRAEAKTKEQIKSGGELEAQKKTEIEDAANEEYALKNWLLYCAKNAHGISMTTHPSKYSHPDAKSSVVYSRPTDKNKNPGFLTIGGISVEDDVIFATAAYMPIYQFLTLVLKDGLSVIDHLDNDTESIKQQFSIVENYSQIRELLLQVRVNKTEVYTDEKIKQVFFPHSENYHLLSTVSSSAVMFSLKKKIKVINSYNDNKDAIECRKNNEYFEGEYKEIKNITIQGHVKSNPQCISQLNKENFGEVYLLGSMPPVLVKRDINFPKQNFFGESFRYFECREVFNALHKLFKTNYNNVHIREGRDYRLQNLMERIIDKMWAVRAVSKEQYWSENSQLKPHQKIWLCDEYYQTREKENEWLDKLCKEIANWIILTYEKLLGKQAVKLDESERLHIYDIVTENGEALR